MSEQQLDLEPIKQRVAAATPGPEWRMEYDNSDFSAASWYDISSDERAIGIIYDEADAELVIALHNSTRTDVPLLIAEVERLREEVKSYEEQAPDLFFNTSNDGG